MIAIIQSNLANVLAYYRMFSYDHAWYDTLIIPPENIVPSNFTTFSGLLDIIAQQSSRGDKDFLLGCHGNPNGLPLPLHSDTQVTANHDLLDLLTSATSGNSNAQSQLMNTIDLHNRPIFASNGALQNLLQKIQLVQSMKIDKLNFRACNIGAGPALRAIHRVLGVSHTEAPTVLFAWTNIATVGFRTISRDQLQRQINTLGFPQRIFSRSECLISSTGTDSDEPALAMSVAVTPNNRPSRLNIRALSTEAIEGWTNNFLYSIAYWACGSRPPGGGYRRGGQLPLIGLFAANRSGFPVLFPGDTFNYLEYIEVQN